MAGIHSRISLSALVMKSQMYTDAQHGYQMFVFLYCALSQLHFRQLRGVTCEMATPAVRGVLRVPI